MRAGPFVLSAEASIMQWVMYHLCAVLSRQKLCLTQSVLCDLQV